MLFPKLFVGRTHPKKLPLSEAPRSICLLRLSAIGDVCHALTIVRTLQKHWPQTELCWIIGKTEAALLGKIPGISFIIFDKSAGWAAYAQLRRELRGKHFDLLLHMQTSMRANMISLLIPTNIRLGFDKKRAKDNQSYFTSHQIAAKPHQHVLEGFFGFLEALGIQERLLRWDIPIPEKVEALAQQMLPGTQPTLIISPCANARFRNDRNWTTEGYAAVAEAAARNHDMRIVLTGGPTPIEQEYGEAICSKTSCDITNLIGKTDLPTLLALLKRGTVLLAPDSGPAHMATAVGTPVIGLYATTNPGRARAYLSEKWLVNKYPEAVSTFLKKEVDDIPWGTRVRDPKTMHLIKTEEVIQKLDDFMSSLKASKS